MPRPTANVTQMQFPLEAVLLDPNAVDDLIRNHGVKLVHWRSMRCPIGMVDPDDVMRRPHDHHENCSNGFIYTKAGVITATFTGNSKSSNFEDMGRHDEASAQIILPTYYDNSQELVQMAPFDRVYLDDASITVVTWHTFAAHVTGVDRLQFPVTKVYDLVDSRGNRYAQGTDFTVRQGQIRWGSRRPFVDPSKENGEVCSVRYTYQPFWYVDRLGHEVRVTRTDDFEGNSHTTRLPQLAFLRREYHFESSMNDPEAKGPDEARQKSAPADGGFGPR